MEKIKKAFSLIEVVIATSIITITVFGVYKLIGENTKIINNSGNILQSKSLFPLLEECIENIGVITLSGGIGTKYNFNFGNNSLLNGCEVGNSNLITIDNIDYILEGEIIDSGITYIDWKLSISSDETKTITGSYKLLDK